MSLPDRVLHAGVCVAMIACFDEPPADAPVAPAQPPVAEARPAEPLPAEPLPTEPRASARLPRDGVVIRERDDGLMLFARDVRRFEVLERLAVRFRFGVIDWEDEDPVVDVFVPSAALEVALARLIEPSPFTLRYHEDGREGRNRLAMLEIGSAPPQEKLEPDDGKDGGKRGDGDPGERRARPPRRYTLRTQAEHEAAMERRAVRVARRRAEALRDLESADPSVRADAVSALDAEDDADREQLLELALYDPDPDVRARAIEAMGFGDGTPELARALADPDPDVLVAALDALSWLSDAGLADEVEPFLGHPNPSVRRAAERAWYYLTLARPQP